MNGLRTRWVMTGGSASDAAPLSRESASQSLSVLGSLIERVLLARGVQDNSGAFLDPKLTELHNPSLMPDIDRAAGRILGALRAGEPIVIYGDYDADGITATAILFHMLRHLHPGADVRTYVPHRMEEGYGLNSEAMSQLASEGAKVIISVDCGVTSIGPAARAKKCGVDLIITDHHNPPAHARDLPDAYAVVHPRRPDSQYPFGELCGAGVAYKLAWRLATLAASSERVDARTRELLIDLLSYAALGSIADIVPLVGENRVIARFGLARIRHVGTAGTHTACFLGLQALIDAAGLSGANVSAMDVGFKLAPRLNAAGRLGHARSAIELLTTANLERAGVIAAELSTQNTQRRTVEAEIFEQAAALAEEKGMTAAGRHAIVLADPRWHPGVVGIVCSRLVERFRRPTILLQQHGGTCQGSGRSIDGFSLHGALVMHAEMLERFGGHDMAAGLSLRDSNLDRFTALFIEFASRGITPDQLIPRLPVDCEAAIDELTPEVVRTLERLGPFGRGNPQVRFVIRGLRVAMPPKVMGAHAKHLAVQMTAGDENGGVGGSRGPTLRLVGWNWGEHLQTFRAGSRFDVVIEPRVSTWNGVSSVEGELKDAKAM